MATKRRRKAKYEATLIYLDGPQLILLKSQSTRLIAVRIPTKNEEECKFLSVSVSDQNWDRYIHGYADLRFLFTFPKMLSTYIFDLMDMQNDEINMEPFEGRIPEKYLPAPRLFSSAHTEEYEIDSISMDEEELLIDGEWEMPEFGQFYQKYSDVYAFIAAIKNWRSSRRPKVLKARLSRTFRDKPFQGGFSYVHFFNSLTERLPKDEKLTLDKISYASPGEVVIGGRRRLFGDVEKIINIYLDNRPIILQKYGDLRKYLSESQFLRMPGANYPKGDPSEKKIMKMTEDLCASFPVISCEAITELSNNNALVTAKIVLSLCRRIEDAATYFAQGRMTFDR